MGKSEIPIVIGGFYRSGTSLVRRLLDSHSHIHCGPEVKFFKDFYGDYLDDPLASGRFFSTARTYGLPNSDLLAIFGSAFVEFHERAAANTGKQRWADKNPENVIFLEGWQTLLPNGFVFIHVVRHPLDTLASLKEARFPRAVPAAFPEKARMYLRFRETGEAYCRAHSETAFVIGYEDLVTAPEPTLRRLFAFLDEPYEPQVLNLFNSPERRTGIEDPKVAHTQNVHSDSVGRWLRDLTDDEIASGQEILRSFLDD